MDIYESRKVLYSVLFMGAEGYFNTDDMKNEKQLQAAMVVKFRELYPEKKLKLWSTRNTTFSPKDGMTQKAMGMVAGVSDLMFFEDGILRAIEVKFPGQKHSVKHIKQQYEWGLSIVDNGGSWSICTSVDSFINSIKAHNGGYSLCEVGFMIHKAEEQGKSTITFK